MNILNSSKQRLTHTQRHFGLAVKELRFNGRLPAAQDGAHTSNRSAYPLHELVPRYDVHVKKTTACINIGSERVCYLHSVRDPKTVDLQPLLKTEYSPDLVKKKHFFNSVKKCTLKGKYNSKPFF